MKTLALFGRALSAAVLSLALIVVAAATLTPSSLTSDAQSQYGQSSELLACTVSIYQVCDQQCVSAVDPSGGIQTNGSSVTVSGPFHASMQGRGKTFKDVIVVDQ